LSNPPSYVLLQPSVRGTLGRLVRVKPILFAAKFVVSKAQ